jgi:hypothetical protein
MLKPVIFALFIIASVWIFSEMKNGRAFIPVQVISEDL